MNRQQIYKEMEEAMGLVPTFFKALPDTTLELEWNLFKASQMQEGPIPNKYRELIGVAVSAITHCPYCTYFHTEMARVNGATDNEIEDAYHFAKSTAGWSTYIHGQQMDINQFKTEVKKAADYVRKHKR